MPPFSGAHQTFTGRYPERNGLAVQGLNRRSRAISSHFEWNLLPNLLTLLLILRNVLYMDFGFSGSMKWVIVFSENEWSFRIDPSPRGIQPSVESIDQAGPPNELPMPKNRIACSASGTLEMPFQNRSHSHILSISPAHGSSKKSSSKKSSVGIEVKTTRLERQTQVSLPGNDITSIV
jgi:hypothetical protein